MLHTYTQAAHLQLHMHAAILRAAHGARDDTATTLRRHCDDTACRCMVHAVAVYMVDSRQALHPGWRVAAPLG